MQFEGAVHGLVLPVTSSLPMPFWNDVTGVEADVEGINQPGNMLSCRVTVSIY